MGVNAKLIVETIARHAVPSDALTAESIEELLTLVGNMFADGSLSSEERAKVIRLLGLVLATTLTKDFPADDRSLILQASAHASIMQLDDKGCFVAPQPPSGEADASVVPIVHIIFDETTNTAQYIVSCPDTKQCAVIDSVWDFDLASGRTSHKNVDVICAYVAEHSLDIAWVLDTHAHADHLSAIAELKAKFPGAKTGIGERITVVQSTFKDLLDLEDLSPDGSQYDKLFADGEAFPLGRLKCRVISTPGHTPACVTYLIGDAAFCGDSIFMPDAGSARCDFPNGSATTLFESVTAKLYALPDATRVFVGHDYGVGGRPLASSTTVGELKKENKQLNAHTSEEEFVAWRTGRDKALGLPRLIVPSIQVCIRGGRLPPPNKNGHVALVLPIDLL